MHESFITHYYNFVSPVDANHLICSREIVEVDSGLYMGIFMGKHGREKINITSGNTNKYIRDIQLHATKQE